jgi:hypothetical protein
MHPKHSNKTFSPSTLQPSREVRDEALARARRLADGLFPHQVEGLASLLARRRAILADDMGLGKTASVRTPGAVQLLPLLQRSHCATDAGGSNSSFPPRHTHTRFCG